jgi:hypothetical protein
MESQLGLKMPIKQLKNSFLTAIIVVAVLL